MINNTVLLCRASTICIVRFPAIAGNMTKIWLGKGNCWHQSTTSHSPPPFPSNPAAHLEMSTMDTALSVSLDAA